MSYEINVLVVNQECPVNIPFESSIILHNEIDNADSLSRYFEIWPFFSSVKGILYTLVQEWFEDYYSSYPLCDSDFESETTALELPSWIGNHVRINMTPLIIKEGVLPDFKQILHYLLKTSPCGIIMFHSRYQDGDSEVVLGTITIGQFFESLKRRQILFNTCYIISRD